MNLQVTKWGSIQPTYVRNGKVLSEIVTFHSNGNPHKHNDYEICTVLKGKGKIVIGKDRNTVINVLAGSIVVIPPKTYHWMEVDDAKGMVISIGYTESAVYHKAQEQEKKKEEEKLKAACTFYQCETNSTAGNCKTCGQPQWDHQTTHPIK